MWYGDDSERRESGCGRVRLHLPQQNNQIHAEGIHVPCQKIDQPEAQEKAHGGKGNAKDVPKAGRQLQFGA